MKTTSLELSKLLKEKGFPQNTYWFWVAYSKNKPFALAYKHGEHFYVFQFDPRTKKPFFGEDKGVHIFEKIEFEVITAAPTANEILDLLPEKIQITKKQPVRFLTIEKNDPYLDEGRMRKLEWDVYYENSGKPVLNGLYQVDYTLADAAAKCYIYLKKNKLI